MHAEACRATREKAAPLMEVVMVSIDHDPVARRVVGPEWASPRVSLDFIFMASVRSSRFLSRDFCGSAFAFQPSTTAVPDPRPGLVDSLCLSGPEDGCSTGLASPARTNSLAIAPACDNEAGGGVTAMS